MGVAHWESIPGVRETHQTTTAKTKLTKTFTQGKHRTTSKPAHALPLYRRVSSYTLVNTM